MDCKHAQMLLAFSRKPGEVETEETEALRHHLDDCEQCRLLAQSERWTDAAIGKAMLAVAIPPRLKSTILLKLHQRRPRRIWIATALATAAVLLIGVGVGTLVWLNLPQPFSADEILQSENRARTPRGEVEAWFQRQGIVMAAPANFNYDLLETFDVKKIQGRKIPYLLFVDRQSGAVAWVYVVKTEDAESEPSFTNERRFAVLPPNPGDKRFRYIVIYTGGLLKPFIKGPNT